MVAMERRVVMPVARWQLLFTNFGPYNYLENSGRSFLGGAELMHPKAFGGVDEALRVFRGISSTDFDLIMAQRGVRRLTQAVVDPKTGTTAVFKGGKIPLVTTRLRIPEKIPRWGGKYIGKTLTIGDKQYFLGSAQDWYDMWADLTMKQNAYDLQVHFLHALDDIAPNDMAGIYKVVSNNKHLLDDVRSITKREAFDIDREMGLEIIGGGPDSVRAFADIDVITMQRRQLSMRFKRDTMDKMEDVRSVIKRGVDDEILDGTMFTKGHISIDDRMDAFVAASRELEISSLAPQIDSIKDDVAGFIANPPKNLDDFMGDMQNMTSHIEAVFETIHDFRKITRVRAGSLFAGEADDFEVGSAKMLAAYMDTAEDELVRMMNQLTKNAKAVGLSDIQLARLTDLDNISRLELNNILATRTKITGIEAEIPDFHRTVRKLWKSDPNKAETMSKNFWASQKSRKADIWDEFDGLAGSFKSNRLLASRNFLMSVDKPVFVADYVPEVVGKLTPNHVAYLYGCTGDDLYRGLTRIHTQTRIRPRQDFIIHTRDHANAYAAKFGKTGAELGFTDEAIGEVYDQMWKSLGVNPSILTPDHPTMMQMEEMRQEIHRMYDVTKIADSDVIKWKKYLNSVADDAGQLGTFTDVGGTPDWWAKKESAMVKAKEMHYMAYPNYEDANIIDETMRAIFPFWNYELFRWKWLPRTFMRTPGVMSGLARYMEYTDQGYTSIPGTDLQINPLRGTVFMGGLRSFYLRDFPEFHDPIPGIEFLDYIGRAGFFPGIHVMLPIVGLSSMVSGQPLQIGELLPAWMKTSLSGLRALSPEHIGNILQYIYPDRFRDYMTMMQLASMGYDGDEIWKKKQQSQELTEEEEKLWLQATNNVDGIKGVLMNQTGLFRIRPDEFTQIRREMRLAIEEATGVPVRTQEWIDKMYPVTGKRFTDYYHLDIQQQALLYQWESYRRYQGIITPLYPSSWQGLMVKTSEYYAELERIYTDVRYNGVYEDGELVQQSMVEINRQLVEGIIGPDQWRAARSRMQQGLSAAANALGNSPPYKDVPTTFEERCKVLEEQGRVTPTQTPDQELLYYYYELSPELKYNWESGRMELDFDTYYAYIDALLEALAPEFKERLLERIQNDWTPMEKLYWQFSREFARPYRNLKTVVLNEYTDEEVMIIRRYEVARGDERIEIQNIMGADGKLIAGYQKRLREARQRYRILDPTLDAWLYFFGTTDKFMSHESEEIYNGLTEQYLTPAMIGEAK